MKPEIEQILEYLNERRGFDFTDYRPSLVVRKIGKKLFETSCEDYSDYLEIIYKDDEELDSLIDELMVRTSGFYRDPFVSEYIAQKILPTISPEKRLSGENTLKIWSVGCGEGEEAYSLAILVNELKEKENLDFEISIIGTDIDNSSLKRAEAGLYSSGSIKNVKYGLFEKYFTKEGSMFRLNSEVKENVTFSVYDILYSDNSLPLKSEFGAFDMVFYRNHLIFLNKDLQKMVFKKLYQAIKENGYLVLGTSETPLSEYKDKFNRINGDCHIYRRI